MRILKAHWDVLRRMDRESLFRFGATLLSREWIAYTILFRLEHARLVRGSILMQETMFQAGLGGTRRPPCR